MDFKFKNAISLTYLSLISLLLFLSLLSFGFSITDEIVEILLIGPYQFDYNHLCCVSPQSNVFIKSMFFGVTSVGLLCYLISGYSHRKWLIITANLFGIVAILIWHFFLIVFFFISGLEH